MNVLHINTLQTAGAALCAIRINKALEHKGINSSMLFAQGPDMPIGVDGAIAEEDKDFWHSNKWLLRLKYLLSRSHLWRKMDKEKVEIILKQTNNKLYLHGPFSNYKNIAHHPLVEWADVIHLHWVAYFVDYPTFFKQVSKPIVWTLHDYFPAMGAMHFESDFYPVPDCLKDIDAYCRRVKTESLKHASNLNLVAISEQMVSICNESDVVNRFPVTVIHNGVDTEIFKIYDRREARKILGLPEDEFVFLFSSNNLDDENKGLDRVIKALEMVNVTNSTLVCIGGNESWIPLMSTQKIKIVGYVNSQETLALYYSASDLYLQGSYIESFGQTVVEAMACGTPVVSTPSGISPELVKSFNGVLSNGFDSKALAISIKEGIAKNYDRNVIRQYILENYDYEKIAQQYIQLYNRILQSK